jgi:hypothetical protein
LPLLLWDASALATLNPEGLAAADVSAFLNSF